jgi:hypothetical protein
MDGAKVNKRDSGAQRTKAIDADLVTSWKIRR